MSVIAKRHIEVNPHEKLVEVDLLPLTVAAEIAAAGAGGALPYATPWIVTGYHPVASIHIYGESLVGLTADVVVSNIEHETAGEVVQADVAANKVVTLTKAAARARVVVKTLTSGKLGIRYCGTPQS